MTVKEGSSIWRRYVMGKPARWQGIVWLALGVGWLGVSVISRENVWFWLIGGVYVALGAVTVVAAVSDHRHGRGRYAPRREEPDDLDRLQAAFDVDGDDPLRPLPSRPPAP